MNVRLFSVGLLVAGLMVFGAQQAQAKSEHWHQIATLKADGKDAQEVSIPKDRPAISVIRIAVTEGSVIINTIVVREGGKKNPITVGQRIEKGDHFDVAVGDDVPATGLRISHDGRGTYEVHVK